MSISIPRTVLALLVCAASVSGQNMLSGAGKHPCSGSTHLVSCDAVSGICDYKTDSETRDVSIDSSASNPPQTIRFHGKPFHVAIALDSSCTQASGSCPADPFGKHYDGSQSYSDENTGPATAHASKMTCQYKLTIKTAKSGKDPIIIVK